MTDFRGKAERDQATASAWAEQMEYKQEFERVRRENRQLHEKLDKITRDHGELQAQFNDLLSQFRALRSDNKDRADELLKMAKNLETMVSQAYEKQGNLMDRFRADLSVRLSGAKSGLTDQTLLEKLAGD